MGLLPVTLGSRMPKKMRMPERLWLAGVAVLAFIAFVCMDVVNWFSLPLKLHGSGMNLYAGVQPSIEALYYLIFVVLTIGCDWLFIVATRWLLRKGSQFDSRAKIIGLMLGNVLLACFLVVFPVGLAWGLGGLATIVRSARIVPTILEYVNVSNPHQIFLASLGASNLLDGIVACLFFFLLSALLVHRVFWPSLQRPVYALASRGIVRRRRLFFTAGLALVALGGIPKSTIHIIGKILTGLLGG